MHLRSVTIHSHQYPTREYYPFNLPIFHQTQSIQFTAPVSMWVGENGTGKSTLLEALAQKCGIYIWRDPQGRRYQYNPYEQRLREFLSIEWYDGAVPGSFFGSSFFQDFVQILEEWAAADPGQLKYFGGQSLMTKSHGQSILSFFRAGYQIPGLFFLDEPETALSPKSQFELLKILTQTASAGHAQFIIATHSPILLACPAAMIYSFDAIPVQSISYEATEHYRLYKSFMEDRDQIIKEIMENQ